MPRVTRTQNSKRKAMQYYVYLLFSDLDKGLYIGYTNNLKRRLLEHGSGKVYSTKNRRPIRLIYYECFLNKADAKAREEYLKSGYGRLQLKSILKHTIAIL